MSEKSNEVELPDVVMVHPDLEGDPINKQGQIGVITAAILNTDEFYVGFENGEVGLYGASALLAFKPLEEIDEYLLGNPLDLDDWDLRPLKNVGFLLFVGGAKESRVAMEIVQNRKNLLPVATKGLDEILGLSQKTGLKR